MIGELLLLELQLGFDLLELVPCVWKIFASQLLIHPDLVQLHVGAGPHTSHTKFGATLEAVDGLIFPIRFISQVLDGAPEFFILLPVVLDLEATGAGARNLYLLNILDLQLVFEVRNRIARIFKF